MAYEHAFTRMRDLYAKLLRFYPEPYRKHFGKSMEQTFNDLCNERRIAGGTVTGLVLWVFIETITSIVKERTYYHMKNVNSNATNFIFPAIAGAILVIPFMIMEWVTASAKPRSDFAIVMFIIMWFFAAVFTFILAQIVRTVSAGKITKVNSVVLGLKVVVLGLIAWAWVGLVIDQMPCFLGASGC